LGPRGRASGLPRAPSATRGSGLGPARKDLVGGRIERRLGDPAESEVDRRRAAGVPARPGHGLAPDGAPAVVAAPRTSTADLPGLVAEIARARPRPGFAPVPLLPDRIAAPRLPPGPARNPLGADADRP